MSKMETHPSNEPRETVLEQQLRDTELKAQKYEQELEKLRQQYADDLYAERQLGKRLLQERRQLQIDYGRLRVQKGGFGLKAMALSGFGGFFTALILCALYLWLRPKADHVAAFIAFRDANLFNYELAISKGDFETIERDLQKKNDQPEYKLIRPEIDFTRKIVGAAKRRCEGK